jgi:hypothetical protein
MNEYMRSKPIDKPIKMIRRIDKSPIRPHIKLIADKTTGFNNERVAAQARNPVANDPQQIIRDNFDPSLHLSDKYVHPRHEIAASPVKTDENTMNILKDHEVETSGTSSYTPMSSKGGGDMPIINHTSKISSRRIIKIAPEAKYIDDLPSIGRVNLSDGNEANRSIHSSMAEDTDMIAANHTKGFGHDRKLQSHQDSVTYDDIDAKVEYHQTIGRIPRSTFSANPVYAEVLAHHSQQASESKTPVKASEAGEYPDVSAKVDSERSTSKPLRKSLISRAAEVRYSDLTNSAGDARRQVNSTHLISHPTTTLPATNVSIDEDYTNTRKYIGSNNSSPSASNNIQYKYTDQWYEIYSNNAARSSAQIYHDNISQSSETYEYIYTQRPQDADRYSGANGEFRRSIANIDTSENMSVINRDNHEKHTRFDRKDIKDPTNSNCEVVHSDRPVFRTPIFDDNAGHSRQSASVDAQYEPNLPIHSFRQAESNIGNNPDPSHTYSISFDMYDPNVTFRNRSNNKKTLLRSIPTESIFTDSNIIGNSAVVYHKDSNCTNVHAHIESMHNLDIPSAISYRIPNKITVNEQPIHADTFDNDEAIDDRYQMPAKNFDDSRFKHRPHTNPEAVVIYDSSQWYAANDGHLIG